MLTIFTSPNKRQTLKIQGLAKNVSLQSDILQKEIKKAGIAINVRQEISNKRDNLLRDNENTLFDQNVHRNTDNRRNKKILWLAFLFTALFSNKGVSFIIGEFYGPISIWVSIFITFILAYTIVWFSIYLNNLLNSSNEVPLFFKSAPYLLVLILPVVNFFEAFDSNYSWAGMAATIFISIADTVLHATLIVRSQAFIVAEDSKEALNKLRALDRKLTQADMVVRKLDLGSFTKIKTKFSNTVKQFVSNWTELRAIDPTAAEHILLLLSNLDIWMINNKIIFHEVLPYHTTNGNPILGRHFFTPEQNSYIDVWDVLDTINVGNRQAPPMLNTVEQPQELKAQEQPYQNEETQQPSNGKNDSPDDYDTFFNNDKEL